MDILKWVGVSPSREEHEAVYDGVVIEDGLREHIRVAIFLLQRIFQLFQLHEIALTFNGGKDAAALLFVTRVALARDALERGAEVSHDSVAQALRQIKILYFKPPEGQFAEVQDYMSHICHSHQLTYCTYETSYKEGMADLVQHHGIKAVLMGVRRGDPHTEDAEHLQPSSAGWPAFLRVNPILQWNYGHIWHFLRRFNLPYCRLYDQGYTSLGSIDDTTPNHALRNPDKPDTFLPAYRLEDYRLERANRCRRRPPSYHAESGTPAQVTILYVGSMNGSHLKTNQALERQIVELGPPLTKMTVHKALALIELHLEDLDDHLAALLSSLLLILPADESTAARVREQVEEWAANRQDGQNRIRHLRIVAPSLRRGDKDMQRRELVQLILGEQKGVCTEADPHEGPQRCAEHAEDATIDVEERDPLAARDQGGLERSVGQICPEGRGQESEAARGGGRVQVSKGEEQREGEDRIVRRGKSRGKKEVPLTRSGTRKGVEVVVEDGEPSRRQKRRKR